MKLSIKLLISLLLLSSVIFSQNVPTIKTIKTDIFVVVYSEEYQQPLSVKYQVECPVGSASRKGMYFYKYSGVITSDDADYVNNVWDKGHLAPAADFNCDKETLKKTFSYLNCSLQHMGLNRGPWKELERYERSLALKYEKIDVEVIVHFENKPGNWLETGALVPIAFTKIIRSGDVVLGKYYFPNINVKGMDWEEFEIK